MALARVLHEVHCHPNPSPLTRGHECGSAQQRAVPRHHHAAGCQRVQVRGEGRVGGQRHSAGLGAVAGGVAPQQRLHLLPVDQLGRRAGQVGRAGLPRTQLCPPLGFGYCTHKDTVQVSSPQPVSRDNPGYQRGTHCRVILVCQQ